MLMSFSRGILTAESLRPVLTRHIHIGQERFAVSLVAATESHLVGRIIINHSAVSPDGSQ